MTNDSFPKYISLREAAKISGYSQDYLSLRARQGKLKATKIGRNWVTTKEWIDEYLKRVAEYKNRIAESKAKKTKKTKKAKINERKQIFLTKPTLTPTSTSTSTSTSFPLGCRARVVAVVCALIFIFGSIGLVFGYPYYSHILKSAGDFIKETATELASGIENYLSDIGETVTDIGENIGETIALVEDNISKSVSDFTIDIFQPIKEYGKALKEGAVMFVSQAAFELKGFVADVSERTNDSLIKPVKNFFNNLDDRFVQYVRYDIQHLKKFSKEFPKTTQEIGKSITQGARKFAQFISQPFQAGYHFITHLWQKPKEPEETIIKKIIQQQLETTKEEIENLKAQLKELKEKGIPPREIKEVEQVTSTKCSEATSIESICSF